METKTNERGEWTSASSAYPDSLCPGRHLAQRGMADTQSDDAAFGTKIHAALATGDKTGLHLEEAGLVDKCNKIEERLLIAYFGEKVRGAKPNPIIEQRFWIEWKDGIKHSGQLDRVHRDGAKALIIEYKTLMGAVPETPRNMQLRDQAVLFFTNVGLLQEIAVAVIQPSVTHDPELCVYSKSDIERARGELYLRVKASNTPGALKTPGEAQCLYCRAKTSCGEYQKWAGSLTTVTPELLMVPAKQWTPAQRAKFCESLPIAQKWLDTCKEEIKTMLKADADSVPGWYLKENPARESITDANGVFQSFLSAGGTLEQFMPCLNVVKAKFKTALAKTTGKKGQELEVKLHNVLEGRTTFAPVDASLARRKE
jgi:hypothetical protein